MKKVKRVGKLVKFKYDFHKVLDDFVYNKFLICHSSENQRLTSQQSHGSKMISKISTSRTMLANMSSSSSILLISPLSAQQKLLLSITKQKNSDN